MIEKWDEVFKEKIPHGDYIVNLINGEETGLVVELVDAIQMIRLDFGEVKAIRMLDEGIVINGVYSDSEIGKFKITKFESIIYKVSGGEFLQEVNQMAGDFAQILDFKHYVLITKSFNIDIISEWEPSIEIFKH